MRQITAVIIVMSFITTIGVTYVVVDGVKNGEIELLESKYDSLKSQYDSDTNYYNEQIGNLTLSFIKYNSEYLIFGSGKIELQNSTNSTVNFYVLVYNNTAYYPTNLPERYKVNGLNVSFLGTTYVTEINKDWQNIEILKIESL